MGNLLHVAALSGTLAAVVACLPVQDARAAEQLASARAPRVIDGDTLALGETRVRLHGIDAPELSQSCRDAEGARWDCGQWSKLVLAKLVSGGVSCEARDVDRYGRIVAVCTGAAGDVNAAMVAAGAAYAYARYATDYVPAERAARAAGRGVWRGTGERPADYRAAGRGDSGAEAAPEGCAIKGNISTSGRIYHMPGSRWYAQTRIDPRRGERWFCSARAAEAAGWRRADG
ncbi:nuclease [Celeribacter indicus]|uniref:Nuclease n=1 Tax=Celeribacter indicus TaxID=1208324 RepID=A0A0B5E711_9RHOB|nr:thermonuclease family protein [Celeribacter indicus]AJE48097.1 nuclease [Celeribacter indicus]